MKTLTKLPGESRNYTFDFVNILGDADLTGTPVISQEVADGEGSLTIGTPSISGDTVTVQLSGGTDGSKYLVVATCGDTASNTLQVAGKLSVLWE